MKKLSEAINELTRLLLKNKRLRRSELKRVLKLTLEGLDDVLKNKSISEAVESAVLPENNEEVKLFVTDLRKFQDAFLATEKAILKRANIEDYSRKKLIRKLNPLRKEIESLVDHRKSLYSMITDAREIVIELLIRLDEPDEEHKNKQMVENQLQRVLTFAGGAAIVATNAILLPAGNIFSQVSVILGSGLIDRSVSK